MILGSWLTWWRDATIGTRIWTAFRGRPVGTDAQGNRYYEEPPRPRRGDKTHAHANGRRWVLYHGTVEASRVPPEWHAWLHHIVKEPPSRKEPRIQPWETRHQANLTGTDHAYHPKGSLVRDEPQPAGEAVYKPWRPDGS